LIADDDRFFAAMLRSVLTAHDDFDVVGLAADGADALAQVRALRPQLVLMDVDMPVLDGIEATAQMRALERPPLVILITGADGDGVDRRAYSAGAAAYLRKSADVVSLVDVVVAVSRVTAATL
jgi:DNA-binding NarL/FixJ family response regulator